MTDEEFVKSVYPDAICRTFDYQFPVKNRIDYDIIIPTVKNIVVGLPSEKEAWESAKQKIGQIVLNNLNI
jgi:hypothetical protein